jgi:hypothetical protein
MPTGFVDFVHRVVLRTDVPEIGSVARYAHTVRFEVLTAASMKMAIFWVVAPCSLVEV